MVIRHKPASFLDEQSKMWYTFNHLRGVDLGQILPHVREDREIGLENLAAIIQLLEAASGDPDQVAITEQKMRQIKQQNCEFSRYYAEYQVIACEGFSSSSDIGTCRSPTVHTTPRLASTPPIDMPLSGGSYQSREVPEWLLSFSRNYAGHACEQARQLLVNASKRALHCLTVTAGYPVRHTPVYEHGLEKSSPPKHDVTEGFMALAEKPEAITLHWFACV